MQRPKLGTGELARLMPDRRAAVRLANGPGHGILHVVGLATVVWALLLVVRTGAAQTPPPTTTTTPSHTRTPTPTATATPSPTLGPFLVADTNCDLRASAADFVAAIIVSGDPTRFPRCTDANPYRNKPLTDADFLPILHDIFRTFDPPYTPTVTPTRLATSSRTVGPSLTPSPTRTRTATGTPTPTPTPTETFTSVPTRTHTLSPTVTRTRTPSATPTPTGLAYRLSGNWRAVWQNSPMGICSDGQGNIYKLNDTVYQIHAVNSQLDIYDAVGRLLAAAVTPQVDGTVHFTYKQPYGALCVDVQPAYAIDMTFVLGLGRFGTASATWTYGVDPRTYCLNCTGKSDTGTLTKISGP